LTANCEAAVLWLGRDPPDLDRATQSIRRCEQNARRASEIVNRLRAMVTKDTSKVSEFRLNDAVREIVSLTQSEQRRANVAVKLDLADSGAMVRGDRIQIQQVIMNLIMNAIESMVDTPVAARRLVVRTATAGDGKVRVEVEDRGSGVDPEAADRIFDRLFTTKSGGTGVGLAISKSIIEAHGGRIWTAPAQPQGAVFCFEIPAVSGDDWADAPTAGANPSDRSLALNG
jgi:signal transduction histidine kinase